MGAAAGQYECECRGAVGVIDLRARPLQYPAAGIWIGKWLSTLPACSLLGAVDRVGQSDGQARPVESHGAAAGRSNERATSSIPRETAGRVGMTGACALVW